MLASTVLWMLLVSGAHAATASADFLADMKRSNELESDHRNIMTPEFRQFCIVTREHIVCCAAILVLFAIAYTAVARASSSPREDEKNKPADFGPKLRQRRFLVAPYASTFRARQVALVVAALGLAAAMLTGVLLVVTVALANAMDHGDPRVTPSWRLWLLPMTLRSPSEAEAMATAYGPQTAHDFPPVLRRLWRYQSVVAVGTAAFAVPLGVLFEATSRRSSTWRRLRIALIRWALGAGLLLGIWTAATRGAVEENSATLRYAVNRAASVCAALPAVLVLVPRGTWALFAWLRACVEQRHERARVARTRHRRLRLERARIELRLEQAIGSWKGGHQHENVGHASTSHSRSQSESDDSDDSEFDLSVKPRASTTGAKTPTRTRARAGSAASHSPARMPATYPDLPRNSNFIRTPTSTGRSAIAGGRPRRASALPSPTALSAVSSQTLLSPPPSPMFMLPPTSPLLGGAKQETPLARTTGHRRHRRRLRVSQSAASLVSGTHFDGLNTSDSDGDTNTYIKSNSSAKSSSEYERQREMERLSRQIKKYHAQLLFVRTEMTRMERSGILADAGAETTLENAGWKRRYAAKVLASVSAGLLIAATALCWLLVVLQVGRGALSAIFVGEPDLTHSFTYFLPAVATPPAGSVFRDVKGMGAVATVPAASLVPHALATACQLLSAALLFVVVMFGLLSMGSSFEDSVHPLRFLASSYAGGLLRARQWECLPRILLHPVVRQSITPVVFPDTESLAVSADAANVFCRVYFSSSADLTSFYRHLQRQAAASSTAPATLLPGGILPEGFFQARTWGRRVFLLLDSSARPLRPTALLSYVWIVCGLAMTWPSVLRTAGLISERAYVLPVASLVEPLWKSPAVPGLLASVHLGSGDVVVEDDEMVIVRPAPTAVSVVEKASENCQTLDADLFESMCVATAPLAAHAALLADAQEGSAHKHVYVSSPNAPPLANAFTAIAADPASCNSAATNDSAVPLQTTTTTTAAPVPLASGPVERRVSRRVLHQSLSAMTLPRLLVRALMNLASRVSSQLHVSLGWMIWWTYPDLIVPLSPETVDLQVGYVSPVPLSQVPLAIDFAMVDGGPGYSEWFGMLRRLELQNTWLPQAKDGTPLVLQPPATNQESSKEPVYEAGKNVPAEGREKWTLSIYNAVLGAVRAVGVFIYSLFEAAVQRVWQTTVVGARSVVDATGVYVEGTIVGRTLRPAVLAADRMIGQIQAAISAIWSDGILLVWHHASTAATSLSSSITFIVSRAIPLVVNTLANNGGYPWDNKHQATAVGLSRRMAAGDMVPSLFVPDFWEAAIGLGTPALQRLRPELWPHLFASRVSDDGTSLVLPPTIRPAPGFGSSTGGTATVLQRLGPIGHGVAGRGASGSSGSSGGAMGVPRAPHGGQLGSEDKPGAVTGSSGPSKTTGSEQQKKQHGDEAMDSARRSAVGAESGRPVRKEWSTMDWLLAVYRVVLGVLACRSVFGPSRSSRVFMF
ncbi:hypothetical protein GGI07_002404 [Coemansia sp. Benny D115]|nr:hypothetical protein GGI07_002404 [Coemansia sp. Benny D115]